MYIKDTFNIAGVKLKNRPERNIVYIKAYRRKEKFGTSNIFRVGVQMNDPFTPDLIRKVESVS